MAASSLALSDLISFQLERFNLKDFVYKDELNLQKKLADLDQQQSTPKLQQQHQQQQTQTSSNQEQPLRPTNRRSQKRSPLQQQQTQVVDVELGELKITEQRQQRQLDNDDIKSTVADGYDGNGTATTISSVAGSMDSIVEARRDFKTLVLEWFQQLREQTSDYKSEEESKRVREAGNNSYRKERHALKACDYFTEALFLAPVDSIAAAMAHANRSTVLHDCGMYEQAYDDCMCALDLGYPEEYYPLIKLRQASCALKMRNFVLCEEHLHELLHMELSESFESRTHEIWHECEMLKSQKFDMGVQTSDELPWNGAKVYEVAWHDNTNIITTNKGACIRATTKIMENSQVFQENSTVFVTNGQTRICDNCAKTQFIPFPCPFCSNRTASYCSRKCRAQHASLHAIECFAHQIELFEEFSEEFIMPRFFQLALRMLINGLPQVMPHCRKKPTVNKMWAAFNGVLTERNDIPYSALLRLETHINKEDVESIVTIAIIAHILTIYLLECTDFFEQLEYSMPAMQKLSQTEWELLASALLLRHMLQLRHKNLIHCPSFALPVDHHLLSPINEFIVWANNKHVRPGYLHLLAGDVTSVALAVFPHTLSLCRHSCHGSIYRKFSGRNMIAYATTDIPAGSKIYNCFSNFNYRQSLYDTRRRELNALGIECKCEKCFRPFPDEDFHKFHRYRCDNPNCRQIFTPSNPKRTSNLRWWDSNYIHTILRKYIKYNKRSTRDDNNSEDDNDVIEKQYSKKDARDIDIAGVHKNDVRRYQLKRNDDNNFDATTKDNDNDNDDIILKCSVCNENQNLEWFWTFNAMLLDCDSIEDRCKLYAAIDRADAQLIDMNECKVILARQLIAHCLCMQREGVTQLDEWEFNKLGSIMRSVLPIIAAQWRYTSIEYVQHMSYFWDIMALSSYKCSDKELMQMLNALEFIPDEYKEIFINYYEDYIAPKFVEDTYKNDMDTQV